MPAQLRQFNSGTATHPASAYRPTGMTLEEFKQTMEAACFNYWGTGTRSSRYRRFRVLAVAWERDLDGTNLGLNIGSTKARVMDVFSKSYRYDVEELSLEFNNSASNTFTEGVEDLLSGLGHDDLAILYYIGHGAYDATDHRLRMTPSPQANLATPFVDFHEVRTKLIDPAEPDVLILLDCCHAASGTINVRKELIAAAAHDGLAHGGADSFSAALVQQLEDAISKKHIYTTSQLYNRLATRAMISIGGEPQLRSMPVFLRNSDSPEYRMPIVLAPNFPHDDWRPGDVNPVRNQPANVIMHVHLRDVNESNAGELRDWLVRGHPHNVMRVEIKDILPSFSCAVIIRASLDVWYTMPDHPAISFICLAINRYAPILQTLPEPRNIWGPMFPSEPFIPTDDSPPRR
ncbi:hypothetical protein ACRALDRAFT_1070029 [Sodiomyces alcalophilus JCM 7366]|uniref:uncharacterized protein n=1 Tax=Sodiomyces alcalophilus JCM 7366 TaxID=591952 RepID=UPI0039B4FBD4